MLFLTSLASYADGSLSVLILFAGYTIGLVIYRLYFSPLAKFPGSRLAAATSWYEFYYDWWLDGRFVFEVERLHNKYGPIVRINPNELSIRDPSFYNEIYVSESKRRSEHYDAWAGGINFDGSFILTKGHELHKKRREPFDPFFSRKGITSLHPTLAELSIHLESRLRDLAGQNRVIKLDHAFSCFARDVIGTMCLGRDDYRDQLLHSPEFSSEWYDLIHKVIQQTPLFTQFPWLIQIVSRVPARVLLWVFPRGQAFNTLTETAREHIRRALDGASEKNTKSSTLFHQLVNGDMPTSEKTENRLTKEAMVMFAGGTVTVARTLTVASYYILSRPELRLKLADELESTMAEWPQVVPSLAELERLPLLQAIIKETLRLSYGVMHRLPRVSPDVPIQYREFTIPTGVPVGMSAYYMHSDPTVYPSPDRFIPERWIGDIDPAMRRSFVPFCKGSRHCIGKNLAQAEISLLLAVLFRPEGPGFELFETDESDVKMAHDFLIPLPRLDSEGVRVIVR
ncbi:cytochrome p450 [Seiridium cupressi]